jgi:hypothetical protein
VNEKLHGSSSRGELVTERKPKLDAHSSEQNCEKNSDESHGFTLKVNEEAEDSKEQHDDVSANNQNQMNSDLRVDN